MDQPRWLEIAWAELGVQEGGGGADNPRVQGYFRDAGRGEVTRDEVPWCAAFVGACLERAGRSGTRSLLARSYLVWGHDEKPRCGAIAVLKRGSDPAAGHVGFVVGETGGTILLLGGNQGDRVSVAPFKKSEVLAVRWPEETRIEDGFARALAHVLRMEGGFTDDPHDPGGPTNKGITLSVFAAWRGLALGAANRDELIGQLKAISATEVRQIYRRRYWDAAGCAPLATGLALMHFDAAVNHGVRGATKLLQTAAGATVDGEIGPETLAAIDKLTELEMIDAYAQARRKRYRGLAHFWRFGRGWLRRVDETLAKANEVAKQRTTAAEKGLNMSEQSATADGKWWAESLTIWGTIVTGLATVLPALGPLIGLNVTEDIVRQAGGHIVAVVQAVGGLIGIAMTVYGRARASQPLERRQVQLKI